MRLFPRTKPPGDQRANAGARALRPSRPAAEPPGWDGEPRGEPGVHGVPRARRWDMVLGADAPGLRAGAFRGDTIRFVVTDDGEVVAEEPAVTAETVTALRPLADAVTERLDPPYRAEAVRRDGDHWTVAARRIVVLKVTGLDGDDAELVSTRDGRALHVDGRPLFGAAPALERAGAAVGAEYVVRAHRLARDRWEIEATPL